MRSMAQAWTGGQYSLVRMAGGLLLALHFLERAAAASAGFTGLLDLLLAGAAIAFSLGRMDRPLSLLLAFALMAGCDPGSFLGHAGTWYASFWMLAHFALPPLPYGSLDARGRPDPRGDWFMPAWAPAAAWTLLLAHHAASGVSALAHGAVLVFLVELALAASGVLASWRPMVFALSLGLEAGRWLVTGQADPGLWLLHLVAMQPAWWPPRESSGTETVFYDGTCALCHGVARFLLCEDTDPPRFRMAPLGGDAFTERMSAQQREDLPDSVVVRTDAGRVLIKADAALYVLDRIGGLWRPLAFVAGLVPDALLERAYMIVASNRYRWFGRKSQACPILAGDLRARFDA